MDGRRTPHHGMSSSGLCPDELLTIEFLMHNSINNIMHNQFPSYAYGMKIRDLDLTSHRSTLKSSF
jgi:hypothetical protein